MRRKSYVDTTADLSRNKNICYLLQLMMSIDAIRSVYRRSQQITNATSELDSTDRFIALVTMMGWTGECIRLIHVGEKGGYVRRKMLKGKKDCLELWDEIHEKPKPKLIAKFHRIRDNCCAHWLPPIAKNFLQRLHKEPNKIAFVETGEHGEFMDSCFPWVSEAIAGDLLNVAPGDADRLEVTKEWDKLFPEIGQLIGRMAKLAQELGIAILKEQGLKPRES